jgi:hypothetical protein
MRDYLAGPCRVEQADGTASGRISLDTHIAGGDWLEKFHISVHNNLHR